MPKGPKGEKRPGGQFVVVVSEIAAISGSRSWIAVVAKRPHLLWAVPQATFHAITRIFTFIVPIKWPAKRYRL